MTRPAHRHRLAVAAVATLIAVAAACSDDGATEPSSTSATAVTTSPSTTSAPATTTEAPASTTTSPPVVAPASPGAPRQLPAFAAFTGVPLLDDSTPYAGPATPTSLDDVLVSPDLVEWVFPRSPGLVPLLEAQGFAVEAHEFDFFHNVYESLSYGIDTAYVTTDTMYHHWHLAFAKVLRDTEEQVLAPALAELLTGLVAAARAQADELAGGPLADTAERVVAYYEVAAELLGLDVGPVSQRATDAVALATDAAQLTTSPITGFEPCQAPERFEGCVDYTQFRPRGHYTRSDTLQRYFRAMAQLGQEAFYIDQADSLRLGLLASRLVTEDPALAAGWRQVYEPTAFLVGVADDYTPFELEAAAGAVLASSLGDPAGFADDATVDAIAAELIATRPVGIDPENASVRVMGARLVLDSFVLDQLAWPNVGTEEQRRVHVSALDLASAFGSPLATGLQAAAGETSYANYDTQLAAMQTLLGSRQPSQWAGTVYDAWLYALEPQFTERGAAFPDYMRTPAWAAKSLQTAFGSYTELKHDTILYSKQGTAGEAGGPDPQWVPYHTVEPDPVAFGRIAAVATLCRDGLDQRGLLPAESAELLDAVVELASWLAGIASAELAGEVTSDEDQLRLAEIGSELELLWFESSDIEADFFDIPANEDRAALVADIFRSSFEYLQLGTGNVDKIYVIVPTPTGEFQVAQGAVYSYYEFWRPASELRLTDEEWWMLLDAEAVPPRPAWQAAFLVGGEVASTPRVVQEVG